MLPSSSQGKDDTSNDQVVNLENKTSLSPFDLSSLWDKETITNVYVTIFANNRVPYPYDDHYIKFNEGIYSSKTIRINNVSIPFSSERGYGHHYIYICLPDVIENFIRKNTPEPFTNLVGSKYHGEEGEWWKLAYHIEGVFKVADKNQICTPVSLKKILNHSKMGVRANIAAEFSIMRYSEEFVIDVKIVSGIITSMDVDIKPPTPIGIIPGRLTPQDITSDDIMKNLEKFKDVPSSKQT